MRSILAACLLLALCASAGSATAEQNKSRNNTVIRARPAENSSFVAPSGARIYRDNSVSGGLRTDHDPPPLPNDPSRLGGG